MWLGNQSIMLQALNETYEGTTVSNPDKTIQHSTQVIGYIDDNNIFYKHDENATRTTKKCNTKDILNMVRVTGSNWW